MKGRRRAIAVLLLSWLLLAAPAQADEYDARDAGHPFRIAAYFVHPIGVVVDYLVLRPAHWVVSHEPLATLFGHEEE